MKTTIVCILVALLLCIVSASTVEPEVKADSTTPAVAESANRRDSVDEEVSDDDGDDADEDEGDDEADDDLKKDEADRGVESDVNAARGTVYVIREKSPCMKVKAIQRILRKGGNKLGRIRNVMRKPRPQRASKAEVLKAIRQGKQNAANAHGDLVSVREQRKRLHKVRKHLQKMHGHVG
jgi:hypothetical protein